jgi:hypothetical protein
MTSSKHRSDEDTKIRISVLAYPMPSEKVPIPPNDPDKIEKFLFQMLDIRHHHKINFKIGR